MKMLIEIYNSKKYTNYVLWRLSLIVLATDTFHFTVDTWNIVEQTVTVEQNMLLTETNVGDSRWHTNSPLPGNVQYC